MNHYGILGFIMMWEGAYDSLLTNNLLAYAFIFMFFFGWIIAMASIGNQKKKRRKRHGK